jgi:uncharacterized protein (DUF3820 family)
MTGVNPLTYIDYVYAGSDEGAGLKYFKQVQKDFKIEKPLPTDMCVCGHGIKKNCYLRHKTANDVIVIGNCCIKKFIPEDQRHRTCSVCDQPHHNRNHNICNTCKISDPNGFIIPLGKHKGEKLIDIFNTDPSYFSWLETSDVKSSITEMCEKIRQANPNQAPPPPPSEEDMYVLTFGKHRGKTLDQIYDENPRYIEWIAENLNDTNPWKEKARVYLVENEY